MQQTPRVEPVERPNFVDELKRENARDRYVQDALAPVPYAKYLARVNQEDRLAASGRSSAAKSIGNAPNQVQHLTSSSVLQIAPSASINTVATVAALTTPPVPSAMTVAYRTLAISPRGIVLDILA